MYNPMDCGQETNAIFESLLEENQVKTVIMSTEKLLAFLNNDHSTAEEALNELM